MEKRTRQKLNRKFDRLTISTPESISKKIRDLAQRKKQSVSKTVTNILRNFLDKGDK